MEEEKEQLIKRVERLKRKVRVAPETAGEHYLTFITQ